MQRGRKHADRTRVVRGPKKIAPENKAVPVPATNPIIEDLDVSLGWDQPSHLEIVINRLKQLGRYKENLLFRGIDGNKLDSVRIHGTDLPQYRTVYCSTESELFNTGYGAYHHAIGHEDPVMVVYDGDKLETDEIDPELPVPLERYRFKVGYYPMDALVAAFRLVLFKRREPAPQRV